MVLDYYFDLDRQERVAGPLDPSIVPISPFAQNTVPKFRIRALQPTGDFKAPYSLVSNIGKTLQFALGTKGGSQLHYVEQYSWTANPDQADPYFEADVSFNTGGISTLLGSSESKQTFLEVILVEDGNPKRLYSKLVTVEASVIKNDALTVIVGQTPLSLEVALEMFLTYVIKKPVTFVCPTDDTKRTDLFTGTDGEFHENPS